MPRKTVQNGAKRCNTVQNGAKRCNTVQNGATLCKTVQHCAKRCKRSEDGVKRCKTVQNGAKHENNHNSKNRWRRIDLVWTKMCFTAAIFGFFDQKPPKKPNGGHLVKNHVTTLRTAFFAADVIAPVLIKNSQRFSRKSP